ncbi:unnamed protein product [Phaeothamnion confervicola]
MKSAQGAAEALPGDAFRALLPAVDAAWYLGALEAAGFDLFHPSLCRLPRSHLRQHWRLAAAVFGKKF